ncbi:MAG TPA: hypothetical protein VMW12_08015 [Candidatus Dormibacteraeota bacterium]|nr:hypothetical protein [Candidatus Dormibacteraeota bacterium]
MNLSKFFIAACLPAAILASCTPATHESAAGSPAPVASPAAVVSEVRVPTSAPASATPSIAPSVAPLSRAAQTPVPAASAVSTGAPGSAATTAPAAVPAATATASAPPSPAAAPTPAPAPAPKRVPIRPADAAPKIVSVSVSQRTMHPGQTISGTVLTSSNVASVEVRIATYSIDMQKVGVGRFAMAYTVPNVPVFFRGNYTMQVIARNSAGDQASRGIPITIR